MKVSKLSIISMLLWLPLVSKVFAVEQGVNGLSNDSSWDIVGIKLGSPVDSAISALKSYNQDIIITPFTGQLKQNSFVSPPLQFGAEASTRNMVAGQTSDKFNLIYDLSPAKDVIGISRVHVFAVTTPATADPRPSIDSMELALKEKYGKPDVQTSEDDAGIESGRQYFWFRNAADQYKTKNGIEKCRASAGDMFFMSKGSIFKPSQNLQKLCGTYLSAHVFLDKYNGGLVGRIDYQFVDNARVINSFDYIKTLMSNGAKASDANQKAQADKVKPRL
jgi:hypothetical protein